MSPTSFTSLFLAAGPIPAWVPVAELERLLGEIIDGARTAWPGIALSPADFLAHLRQHVPLGEPVDQALRKMQTSDLYLARACAAGDAQALAAFDRDVLSVVDEVVARQRLDREVSLELKQQIRSRVLVADGGPPSILTFRGRGELRGWVRVIATRAALDVVRRARREVPMGDEALLGPTTMTSTDPELEHLKIHYRDEFKRAFEASLAALAPRDLTLLRQSLVDGLTLDELGALYHMHRATIARGLERARAAVREGTRARLRTALRVQSGEVDSILRLIRSRLEASLRALFRRPRERPVRPATRG